MESSNKKLKLTPKRIGTHDGTFHCDEALACYMLRLTDDFKDSEVVRTRNPQILAELDCIVDVGGEYVPERYRFDHHQREFTSALDDKHTTKLSSAGLIYKHFGHKIMKGLIGDVSDEILNLFYETIYTRFVEPLDAIDNGINQYDTTLAPRYTINTDLSSRVKHLNSNWNDKDQNQDERFKKAMELAGSEFVESILHMKNHWLPARELVENAVATKDSEFGPKSEIIKLAQFGPWQDHLETIEKEKGIEGLIKFVLFSDRSESWRIQAVPVRPGSFDNRLGLPTEWRGLRDEALSEATGIKGCVFVHASGFIGGANSAEGVIEMAKKSLAMAQK
eukprot:TRINITY_DN7605_c0_g1_i1.p1 TRINITY_DN7605_c0_g1~~TRINITY_DN7605_c0_g1_i1.p1  ORF type:complete len:363 (-),score=76.31 TRINITY_DN7605_c0_g1_i1:53-1057(-)